MEGLLHYINPAHAISLLSALNEERLKGQLCDVLLIVGDQKFRAHKNVLAASSEYFQSLFTNKENEAQTVFQLDFCEPDAFDNVLNYIYSSSLFVEKSSLAAVQELGYSLGISFLTNIVSKTPQAPFPTCPNRKKIFVEEDESSSQKRSVIVCQSRNEAQGKTVGQNQPDLSHTSRPSPGLAVKTGTGKPHVPKPAEAPHASPVAEKTWPRDGPAGCAKSLERPGSVDDPHRSSLAKSNAGPPGKPLQDREGTDEKPCLSGQLPKGKAIELALKRPRPPVLSLRSASETPYVLKETGKGGGPGEDRNLLYYSKLGLVVPSGGSGSGKQGIDRSGPLVKSLLRRSLSMDSQVPVYSPAIDLKPSQGPSAASGEVPANVFCALSQKPSVKECGDASALDERTPAPQPHRLRSFSASQSTDREGEPAVAEVRVKTEPRSPLSDPSDIIRVTVGDPAAASSVTRDLSLKTEDDQRDMSRLPAKRRFQADRRLPFKKVKEGEHGSPVSEQNLEEGSSPPLPDADFPDSDLNKEEFEQGSHERLCRNATVCPYCSLRFFSPELKREHEGKCEYKKLTCLECMRTFKSSFSIWRHQVEVHNQNTMAPAEHFSLPGLDHNGDATAASRPQAQAEPPKANHAAAAKDDAAFSDCSEQVNFDSEDSSCLPEDLSLSKQLKIHVKEEPAEEAEEEAPEARAAAKDAGPSKDSSLWPCEKCGKTFTAHKQLERHQELLCSVKPFICHVCNKAFRTNFRLWSHFQSHMSQAAEEPAHKDPEACPVPTNSPSPPPLPPPPPLPKIQPLEPDSPTGVAETPAPAAAEKLFVPQESDTLFYHAPPLSAITFKRQFMCKLCHRTFKTAFSLWSHEQSHN
ncbi:zinc finger and BTB domain-containing protein 21 isoform X2 [Panthera tigris]|uniref:zinc finger and BTB domain-containing protein 21 isoform X2 n=1 Tax=Panthera tigris TaxID=9694 RepID=UPI001C6F6A80|nr:zinc finger and BTB domain-containing protein 21 isoform X2 [Panthera tigris]